MPLPNESLGTQAYRWLQEELMSGRFLPGEKLKLRDLAKELGISQTPVREALARLTSDLALVQIDHRSVHVPLMSKQRYKEIFELRYILEGLAAEKAALLASPADIEELDHLHEQMVGSSSYTGSRNRLIFNQKFHMKISEICNQPSLARAIKGLWLQSGPVLRGLSIIPASPPENHPHLIILNGIRDKDPIMARSGIQTDLTLATQLLLAQL